MRKKIILFTTLLVSILSFAKADEIVKNERIQKVIVFRNGAQIESKVSQTIEKGEHLIIINELPNSLDESSVQVAGEGEFTILSVESKSGNPENASKSKAYQTILDSIEYYKNAIDQDNIRKYAIDQEESLFITNKNISSKQTMAVVDLEDMADLYKKRLPELKRESLRLQKIIASSTAKLNYFNLQLQERQSGKNNKQVWVRISLTQAQNVRLNLKYLVSEASWTPLYDVRCEDIGEDIEFILKSNVRQSTGVNWDNVELSLSTGNPINYTAKPVMNDWRIGLSNNPPMAYNSMPLQVKGSRTDANDYYIDGVKVRGAGSLSESVEVSEQVNNIQYNISRAFSIPSDGENKLVEIQRSNAKANFRYVSIPKLDSKAYLLASITDWDKILTQAAEANIFLKGAYVTKTYLDPNSIEDSLEISLGNDDGIKVERKMLKELTTKKILGSSKKMMKAYEISVRNSKSKSIKIDIYDQVPIPTDNNIEVTYVANDASYNPETGKLTWTYTIAPAETKKMNFNFEVKYPKNKYLQGW